MEFSGGNEKQNVKFCSAPKLLCSKIRYSFHIFNCFFLFMVNKRWENKRDKNMETLRDRFSVPERLCQSAIAVSKTLRNIFMSFAGFLYK